MRDFLGNDLKIGDLVSSTYGGYPEQHLFEIVGFTPQKVRIVKADRGHLTSASGRFGSLRGNDTTLKFERELVFIASAETKNVVLEKYDKQKQ
jgi:hypothetical protein